VLGACGLGQFFPCRERRPSVFGVGPGALARPRAVPSRRSQRAQAVGS
jgi:hypothetical protein